MKFGTSTLTSWTEAGYAGCTRCMECHSCIQALLAIERHLFMKIEDGDIWTCMLPKLEVIVWAVWNYKSLRQFQWYMDQLNLKAVTQCLADKMLILLLILKRPTTLKLMYWRVGCNKVLEIFCYFFLKEVAKRFMTMCNNGDWDKLLKSNLKDVA